MITHYFDDVHWKNIDKIDGAGDKAITHQETRRNQNETLTERVHMIS
jgi:hypothetical protein